MFFFWGLATGWILDEKQVSPTPGIVSTNRKLNMVCLLASNPIPRIPLDSLNPLVECWIYTFIFLVFEVPHVFFPHPGEGIYPANGFGRPQDGPPQAAVDDFRTSLR